MTGCSGVQPRRRATMPRRAVSSVLRRAAKSSASSVRENGDLTKGNVVLYRVARSASDSLDCCGRCKQAPRSEQHPDEGKAPYEHASGEQLVQQLGIAKRALRTLRASHWHCPRLIMCSRCVRTSPSAVNALILRCVALTRGCASILRLTQHCGQHSCSSPGRQTRQPRRRTGRSPMPTSYTS